MISFYLEIFCSSLGVRQDYTGRLSLIKKNIFGGIVREFCFSFTEFFGFDD